KIRLCVLLRVRFSGLFIGAPFGGGTRMRPFLACSTDSIFWQRVHFRAFSSSTGGAGPGFLQGPAAWRVRAAKHIERSIRLLPQDIVEARSQRGCSTLLNQLMMTLSVSLSEAAVSSAELEKLGRDPPDGLPSEALAESYEQLCRAEDLAEAAGHKAGEALARASRGHLCSLAADAVVHAGLRRGDPFGYVLSPEEVEVLRSLCEDDEPDQQDALLFLGRLGDRAVSETFAALQS
ncbi:unnamed protein product, partial [Effrenium voratum]